MTRWLLRRVAIAIPVVIGITMLSFLIINAAPGDPISMMVSPEDMSRGGGEWIERRRAQLGLDKPLPVRYVIWMGELLQGNMGYSITDQKPVAVKIGERLWPTVELMGSALLIALLVGIPLGILSAVRQYSILDYVATVFGFAAISTPSFFLALAAIYIFSLKFDLLPSAGMYTIGQQWTLVDHLRHLVMPALILGLGQTAIIMRYTRSGLLEVLQQDYITTARSKGLKNAAILLRHALRNALIPLITVVALTLPSLFGGAVITEQIFAWPGMGQLAVAAVSYRDYPVLMGFNLVVAILVLVSNLIADVAYALADPRIRYE